MNEAQTRRTLIDPVLRANGEVTLDDLTNNEPFVNYDIASLFRDRIGQFREIVVRLKSITMEIAA